MSDMICRETMRRCLTPGMCAPFGGCGVPDSARHPLINQLARVLDQLDDALEDLEMHGCHSDRGYVRLKAWYANMKKTTDAIDAALRMEGGR